MDLAKVKQLRGTLTLHFAVISWLTAMLVATGSGSIFLPVFIFLVSVAAYVFVERLEWFSLGRITSYIAMLAATSVALACYVYSALTDSESGQLMAVAGLLVYPEAVLFLQRKNLRVFEQLAVFLLLEMIVAALVNDNLLFGVLLIPIMMLWVSSLFLFSRYATLVSVDPTIETPTPKMAELLFKRFVKTVLGESKQASAVSSTFIASDNVVRSSRLRRLMQSLPIGIGALVFAGLFFYLLPRTSPAGFQSGIGGDRSVGLPDRLTFGGIGRILTNRTEVMKVTLKNSLTGKPFKPTAAPYLRSKIFDEYTSRGSDRRSSFFSRGEWRFSSTLYPTRLRKEDRPSWLSIFPRDPVEIEFDVIRKYASAMYSVPPYYLPLKEQMLDRIFHDRKLMVLAPLDNTARIPQGKSLVYRIESAAFRNEVQSPVTPAKYSSNRDGSNKRFYDGNLTRNFTEMQGVEQFRRDLLHRYSIEESQLFLAARTFEQHLSNSGEFTYSLDLQPATNRDLDPIEDFLINQRAGHCQFYAASLVALLRNQGIPSRIVVGYHPKEFNAIGNYFSVRQSDAHAWVEALFRHEELVGTEYEEWLTDSESYWVRFDPTPGSFVEDGGIVEQQGQALDYVQKVWKDYVSEGQKLEGENSLYAPVAENSENAYEELIASFNQVRENIRQGRWWDLRGVGFAWPMALTIVGIGIVSIATWRVIVILPRIAPRLAVRLGFSNKDIKIRHSFYARCLALLESLGVKRPVSETPQEFTRAASHLLRSSGQVADQPLDYLTALYYHLRFGSKQELSPDEISSINTNLHSIEQAVAATKNRSTRPS